jgi:5-formyltetrahydrofolate cyclo-ligase
MPASQKKILRVRMKERRALLFQQVANAGERIAELFFNQFEFPPQTIIGGYWPIGSELDIRPLLFKLHEQEFGCALPCLEPQGITYRLWTPSISLEKKMFHTFEPPSTSLLVFPEVLLVPLLAFDKKGHRLGYGQGHFDRFLQNHKAMTIGIGFKEQEIDKIPHQSHDFALDMILTEQGIIKPQV